MYTTGNAQVYEFIFVQESQSYGALPIQNRTYLMQFFLYCMVDEKLITHRLLLPECRLKLFQDRASRIWKQLFSWLFLFLLWDAAKKKPLGLCRKTFSWRKVNKKLKKMYFGRWTRSNWKFETKGLCVSVSNRNRIFFLAWIENIIKLCLKSCLTEYE